MRFQLLKWEVKINLDWNALEGNYKQTSSIEVLSISIVVAIPAIPVVVAIPVAISASVITFTLPPLPTI